MNITYNGVEEPYNMVTFTDIPNILKVEEIQNGTKAIFTFFMSDGLRQTVTADSQYYVTLFGETITNVMSPSDAKNKRFYISDDNIGTAMSMARAFRNCAGLNADYNIYVRQNDGGIVLQAKTIGKKITTSNYLQRNISGQYMGVSVQDGSSQSILFDSKIQLDVYNADSNDLSKYVTSLEKNWYGDECAFDMSPVLSTLSKYGKTEPYTLVLNVFRDDGEWQILGSVSGYTSVGYHANQSQKYMIAQNVQVLANTWRGSNGVMKLYTYDSLIPYSIMCGPDTFGWNIRVNVMNSAYASIYSYDSIGRRTTPDNLIVDTNIVIPQTAFTNAYYVDIIYNPNTSYSSTTRFDIIKPLKATEYYQRIEWRNEYGGISFFDFTGARSESDNVEIDTYEKNVFDYHDTNEFEKKMIYSNDYKKTVSLTSHLMEEDGKYIFNSLMRSKKVWTTVNGKKYYIIPKSIEVTEDQTYNNIYTAKLTYEYSDI